MQIILFIVGLIGGFIISSHLSGHYEGHKREKGLYFTVEEYTIHIHHYIWMGILLAIMIGSHVDIPVLSGGLVGGILQGLTYRDRFIIGYKTADFQKIYKKFEVSHWGIHLREHARKLKK